MLFDRCHEGVALNKRAHPYYQNIFHNWLLTAIILWDILQKNMQTIYERGITHDGH